MAPNPLVSLIGRLLARSGRKRGNRQTDGRNDKTTTVTLAAPRVNNYILVSMCVIAIVNSSKKIIVLVTLSGLRPS